MQVGDLVRNIHTVRGGEADEHGIIVEEAVKDWAGQPMVKVMWFPNGLVEYMTWMDTGDLEIIKK
jgi:hypothetical protein